MSRVAVERVVIPRQPARAGSAAPPRLRSLVDPGYAAAVLLGSVLFLVAALQQPYSYDELTQINPYGSGDLEKITAATRQPPLGPLAEAGIQHLVGQGQLQQRLLPLLSAVGVLAALAFLLRRLGLRWAGVGALLLVATSPLLVRYSAYTRPYTEALALLALLALAMQAWLETGRRRWLLTAAVTAVAAPLVRVPEPSAFLATSVLLLLLVSRRRNVRRTLSLAGVLLTGLVVGLGQTLVLATKAEHLADFSPAGMASRLGPGLHELRTGFLPTLAHAFPWWPLVLTVVVAAVLVPASRRRLPLTFWPLLAAPVAFAIAYHLAFVISFDALPYRPRFAVFFVPCLGLATAALLSVDRPVVRRCAMLLVSAAVLAQLPTTARVLTRDAAPDFAEMARVLHDRVPADALVLYDRPTPPGASRQPYLGRARYLGSAPTVVNVRDVHEKTLPDGPVWLLFNGQCAYDGRCIPGRRHRVTEHIRGYQLVYAQDRFTLYRPTRTQTVDEALAASASALGPTLGYVEAVARSTLVGDPAIARAALDGLTPAQRDEAAVTLELYGLGQALP